MILNVGQIQDYIKCPMLYKYRHIDNLNLTTEEELFQISIDSVIDKMYYAELSNKHMTRSSIKYAWGDAWPLNIEKDKIMWAPNDNRRRYQIRGLNMLLDLRKYIVSSNISPILINDIYGVQVGRHRIETEMRYVQSINNDITIIDYAISDYIPDETILINYLPLTAKNMIYENISSKQTRHLVYYSTKNQLPYYTVRNKSDYTDLKDTVNIIANCIDHQYFYKQYTDKCKTCMYKIYCNR